jgi:hypothetical protein
MFVRVLNFGHTYAQLFPQSSLAGQMFGTIGEAVKKLEEHSVAKMSTAPAAKNTMASAHSVILRKGRDVAPPITRINR